MVLWDGVMYSTDEYEKAGLERTVEMMDHADPKMWSSVEIAPEIYLMRMRTITSIGSIPFIPT